MRQIILAVCVIMLVAFSSCKKPSGNGSLKLKLNPMFGANQLKLNSTYQAPDGKYYNFTLCKLYLSHIRLIHSDGSYVEVSPLQYIALDDSANLTPTITLTNTTGTFTALQFHIGMDSIQDSAPVNTSNPSDPQYANNDMWWTPSLAYVFIKLEGYAGTSTPPSNGFLYHVGTSQYYTQVTLSKSITTGSDPVTLTVNADFQKIFYGSSNSIDISAGLSETDTQTTDNQPLAQQFITDLSTIFSIN